MTTNPRVITGPHLITTAPKLINCRDCGRPLLAVTVGGLDRHVDPAPLTELGELVALLAGRTTYDLSGPMADHLIRRNVHRIAAERSRPVIATHACVPPEQGHVDHGHLDRAAGLVRRLLGGQVVDQTGDPDAPAPF